MNWPASIRRRFVRLAEEVIELDGDQNEAPSLAAMAHDARELLAKTTAERARSARVRVKASPRVAAKAAERKTRNERMAEIRAVVMKKAGGLCEMCGAPATEAHHLISGPLRRRLESADTVIALCFDCHRSVHRGDLDALYQAQAYCVTSGMHDAAAALSKRIDKINEARVRSEAA